MRAAGYWDMGLSAACYFLYVWCISRFLRKHLQGRMQEGAVFGGLLFCGHEIFKFWLEGREVPYILYAACGHVFLGILVMAVFGGEKEKRLFAAVLVSLMTELIWNFTESFLCCGGLFFIHLTKGGGQATAMGEGSGWILTAVTYGVGIAGVHWLSKPLGPVFEDKPKNWYLYVTVPLGSMVLVTDFVNWGASNGIMVQDWRRFGLYENQLLSHGAMCIFTGLSMAAAGFFVFGMDRIHREERAGERYRSQVAYYEMMEEQYSRMERLRHDMKNHMLALENLVQNRRWQQAGEYLRQMAETGSVEAGDEVTGSLVMDALLYHKRQQALAGNVRWQCDVRVPGKCPVKEMDLCIIAGNILDNALEASLALPQTQDPFIQVYMGTIKKCLFLEVKNRTDLDGETAKAPDIGRNKKEEPHGHGLGLSNIRAAAGKYNGAVHVERENGIFTISVLLPLYSG